VAALERLGDAGTVRSIRAAMRKGGDLQVKGGLCRDEGGKPHRGEDTEERRRGAGPSFSGSVRFAALRFGGRRGGCKNLDASPLSAGERLRQIVNVQDAIVDEEVDLFIAIVDDALVHINSRADDIF